MLYVFGTPPEHGCVLPEIGPGVGGTAAEGSTTRMVAGPVPQLFVAVTDITPVLLPAVTVIAVEPCPDVMVQPVGTVQL